MFSRVSCATASEGTSLRPGSIAASIISMSHEEPPEDEFEDKARNLITPSLVPGDMVQTVPGDRKAYVMFVGQLPGMPAGYWVGVQYEEKVGKNDGTLNGKRYFTCPPGHGGFLRASKVTPLEEVNAAEARRQAAAELAEVTRLQRRHRMDRRSGRTSPLAGPSSPTVSFDSAKHEGEDPEGHRDGQSPNIKKRRASVVAWMATPPPLSGRQSSRRERPPGTCHPYRVQVSGSGITSAVVGSLAQFTITAFDENKKRIDIGGDNFTVTMRGQGGLPNSQPAVVRTKVTDRGDGTYMCEYRPWMTGKYSIYINLDEDGIRGSPFSLNVITLRPDAAQCQVRGEALHKAVARVPQKFDVLFVDAIGHTAHAEDLDVWVTPVDVSPMSNRPPAPASEAPQASSAPQGHSESDDAQTKETTPPKIDATMDEAGTDPEEEAASNEAAKTSFAPIVEEERHDPEPTVKRMPTTEDAAPLEPDAPLAPAPSPDIVATIGTPKTPKTPKSARMRKLDAPTRQRHLQLWAARQAADKFMLRRQAEARAVESYGDDAKKKKKLVNEQSLPSFMHELSADRFGFAFGGVDPGTLHAHGKLIKVHHVSYSVGLAGHYKLHVALRQQMVPLPGSPFDLHIEPGAAYPASTKLPEDKSQLFGHADEGWQHGLILQTADMLGNLCVKGGANITMSLPKRWALEHELDDPVKSRVNDLGDGTYELEWCSTLAGTFPLEVCIDGFHVIGSPISVTVKPARPDVNKFKASGAGLTKAVAGVEAPIRIRVADRFENSADVAAENTVFGLVLVPQAGLGVAAKAEKKKADGDNAPKQKEGKEDGEGAPKKKKPGKESGADASVAKGGREKREGVQPPMPDSQEFSGTWVNGCYEIRYVAEQAGTLDLNLWCVVEEGGVREPLPGSPFSVHVTEGIASPIGSYVKDAEPSKQGGTDKQGQIVAGENVVLKPQVLDQFGNPASAPEGSLTAVLDSPGNTGEQLEAPKLRSGMGSYELTLEPLKAGQHYVHVLLNGEEIKGSPVQFYVSPAAPNAAKCYLTRHDSEPILINQQCDILLKTHDKYGNQLDRGGVRVDAKAAGVAASACTVEDHKDGTYTIRLTAGAPGEVKVTARIDSVEIKTMSVFFTKASADDLGEPRSTPPSDRDEMVDVGQEFAENALDGSIGTMKRSHSSKLPPGLPPLAVEKVVPTSAGAPLPVDDTNTSSKAKKGKKKDTADKRRNGVKRADAPASETPALAAVMPHEMAAEAAPATEPTGGTGTNGSPSKAKSDKKSGGKGSGAKSPSKAGKPPKTKKKASGD